jgi:hypothetical protein
MDQSRSAAEALGRFEGSLVYAPAVEIPKELCFSRVLDAFAGRRFAIDAAASKMLKYMLWSPSCGPTSCDATITRSDIEIRYGWTHGLHSYRLDVAPQVVSWFLAAAGARGGEREVRAAVRSIEIPAFEVRQDAGRWRYSGWQVPAFHLWMHAEADRVLIRLRDTAEALAAPIPGPQEVEFPQRCQHCGQVPDRYRALTDGVTLVCLACGRSQLRTA